MGFFSPDKLDDSLLQNQVQTKPWQESKEDSQGNKAE